VTYDGRLLNLTTKEYDLLELFLRDSYHVFSSDEIIDRLWSSDDFPAEATVRSHLRRLRQKLHAAGAPIDAISTIHGRGYYLKSTQTNGNISSEPTLSSAVNRENPALQIDRQQQQYRSFLQETWVTTKRQCLESVSEIQATVDRLLLGECSYPQQELAHQLAHKLVGTLGVFGLMSGMEIARQIELLLDRPTLLMPTELIILPDLLEELATEIEYGETIQSNPNSSADRSFLLFVDLDPSLSGSLAELATNRDIQTMTVANIDAAYGYISTIPDAPIDILTSTVLLVRLASDRDRAPLLGFIANLHQRFSHWSVVVLSERDNLPDRLAVANNGGKFIATAGLTTEQIFTAATSFLQPATTTVKIMVVDDDLDWLRALPQLLQPWGLKTTTLADPQQFLAVLQAVQPEALVLDLNMPEINGLELCQVLRSDPQWQYLPILFVSATNDSIAQQQAFEVGADDYLCKPIMGGELARRIRHRLARGQYR
jgi:DNA-binding response OmpR family regulator/HPt (histidine-containing phosphotransfer) domain-containing protein